MPPDGRRAGSPDLIMRCIRVEITTDASGATAWALGVEVSVDDRDHIGPDFPGIGPLVTNDARPPQRKGKRRSRWSKGVIIALAFSPDQSRQINHLPARRSFGEGQDPKTLDAGCVGLLLRARQAGADSFPYLRIARAERRPGLWVGLVTAVVV